MKISRYRHEFGERQALPQQWFSYKLHWSDQRRWGKWRFKIDDTKMSHFLILITGLSSWLLVPLVSSKRIPRVTNCWPLTSTKTWTVSPRCQTTRGALSLQSHTLVACTCSPQKVNRSFQEYFLYFINNFAHQAARRSSRGYRRPRVTSQGWC